MNQEHSKRIRRIIYYFLYEEDTEKDNPKYEDWCEVSNDKFIIIVLKINPYKFTGMCGQRAHEVYVDSRFQETKSGRILINEVFKPMACLKDSYFGYI